MTEKPELDDPLTRTVIGEAMYVHRVLGAGFLESIYHDALVKRLRAAGRGVECQKVLAVHFEDEIVGKFLADIVVDQILIVELKAVAALNYAHEVQLVNYLAATKTDIGLLINFGASSLEFKRKHRTAVRRFREEPVYLQSENPANLVNPV